MGKISLEKKYISLNFDKLTPIKTAQKPVVSEKQKEEDNKKKINIEDDDDHNDNKINTYDLDDSDEEKDAVEEEIIKYDQEEMPRNKTEESKGNLTNTTTTITANRNLNTIFESESSKDICTFNATTSKENQCLSNDVDYVKAVMEYYNDMDYEDVIHCVLLKGQYVDIKDYFTLGFNQKENKSVFNMFKKSVATEASDYVLFVEENYIYTVENKIINKENRNLRMICSKLDLKLIDRIFVVK